MVRNKTKPLEKTNRASQPRKVYNINDLNVEILVTVFLLLDIKILGSIERGIITYILYIKP